MTQKEKHGILFIASSRHCPWSREDTSNAASALFLSSLLLMSCGCPKHTYPGAFLNITNYKYDCEKALRIRDGVRYFKPADPDKIDLKTIELEKCLIGLGLLTKRIDRNKIGVMIAPDWYKSTCSGQQLIPSRIDYKLCVKKGLPINTKCIHVVKPTKECPCPCNARSAIQDNWLIVTTPNMLLFKAELTRLILWPKYNNPWVKPLNQCLH
jgi:hypothetical protein